MRVAIGSDHRGFELKNRINGFFQSENIVYHDYGCHSADSVDYPDIAAQVGRAVAAGDFENGVLICGTGIGMCIAANKIRGIRAALCVSLLAARHARQHNDANVICFAGDTDPELAMAMARAFLDTEFEGGRHQRRVQKMMLLED
jgi:ribose 5-phosphate isomerase B